MKKSWLLLILLTLLTVAGCALFEPKVNESGQTYTDIENYMKAAGGLLIGVSCFMAGFGIAIILCAAKKGAEIEKKIRINKNYDCVNNLEKKKKFLIGSELMRYGRNVKPDDIWEGLGV